MLLKYDVNYLMVNRTWATDRKKSFLPVNNLKTPKTIGTKSLSNLLEIEKTKKAIGIKVLSNLLEIEKMQKTIGKTTYKKPIEKEENEKNNR